MCRNTKLWTSQIIHMHFYYIFILKTKRWMKIYGWTIRWSRKIKVKDDICTLYKHIVIFHRLIHIILLYHSVFLNDVDVQLRIELEKKSCENNVSNKNDRSKKSISTYIQHTSWIHSSFKIFFSFHLFEFSSLSFFFFFCWFICFCFHHRWMLFELYL